MVVDWLCVDCGLIVCYALFRAKWVTIYVINLFAWADFPACCDLMSHSQRGYHGCWKCLWEGTHVDALKTMVYLGAGRLLPDGECPQLCRLVVGWL